ncbi:MAG TPA: serine--tRNA ligase [Candidatus Woesebacteria bacterium]|nr:serine--tRNA ligase [Candidatus Woesebacteria bacterium]
MLDINIIRKHPKQVIQACTDKQLDPSVVRQLLEVDQHKRDLQQEIDTLRQLANENANAIKARVPQKIKPSEELIRQGKKLKEKLKLLEPNYKKIEDKWLELALQIPNIPAQEVPVAPDESGNRVIKQVGQPRQFEFEAKSHQEVMLNLGWLDTKRAARIGGFRSYFLQKEAVLLEQALLRYALDLMIQHGFTPLTVPVMVNGSAMIGTGYFPWGQDDHYYTQDQQILTGTAEVALTSYHMGETLTEAQLPIKLVGISPCFRREIGAHGKDTQGIIRVHQFTKVEQVVLSVADETVTQAWHEKMLGYAEELLQNLGLPYQVLLMCTGDMGAGQRKKYDIETWFPAQNCYRETHSASYFNDFQSRRLQIRYQAKDGSLRYVHTLNNTVAASPRLLAAIIENYQQKDGTVEIPAVLKRWM